MSGPLIVQSDRTVLLETDHPDSQDARHELAIFAELERAPERPTLPASEARASSEIGRGPVGS